MMDVRAESEIEFAGKCPNPPAPGQATGNRVKVISIVHAERRYDADKVGPSSP